jgi:hypothetical protein
MGLRRAVAPDQGNEALLDAVVEGEVPKEPRLAAAHALADAFLVDPAAMTAEQWATIRAQLSPDDVAEIVLQLTRYSRNKVRRALGLDLDEVVRQPM